MMNLLINIHLNSKHCFLLTFRASDTRISYNQFLAAMKLLAEAKFSNAEKPLRELQILLGIKPTIEIEPPQPEPAVENEESNEEKQEDGVDGNGDADEAQDQVNYLSKDKLYKIQISS